MLSWILRNEGMTERIEIERIRAGRRRIALFFIIPNLQKYFVILLNTIMCHSKLSSNSFYFFQNLSEITCLIDNRLDTEQPREMSHPLDETLLLAYQMRQTLCVMLLNIQASLK